MLNTSRSYCRPEVGKCLRAEPNYWIESSISLKTLWPEAAQTNFAEAEPKLLEANCCTLYLLRQMLDAEKTQKQNLFP